MKINRTKLVCAVVVFNKLRVCLPVLVPEIVASSCGEKRRAKVDSDVGDELLIPTRLFERS